MWLPCIVSAALRGELTFPCPLASLHREFVDAKNALDHLNGYHLHDRYLVVLYHIPARQAARDLARREADLQALKERHNIQDDD